MDVPLDFRQLTAPACEVPRWAEGLWTHGARLHSGRRLHDIYYASLIAVNGIDPVVIANQDVSGNIPLNMDLVENDGRHALLLRVGGRGRIYSHK
jgi:hypothetical protein